MQPVAATRLRVAVTTRLFHRVCMNFASCDVLSATPIPAALLDRLAWHRAIRTEYAAVAQFQSQHRAVACAVIEKLASVSWHQLSLRRAACGTGDG
jgi:hypothetical protein